MQCVWTSGSSSPYDVRFSDVNVPSPTKPSVFQTKNCAITTAATSGTCTFASNVPVGDIVIVGVGTTASTTTVSSVTDGASNTYSKVVSLATQSIGDIEEWKSCITTAGTLTVTVTVSASSTFDIVLYDVTGTYCRTMLSSSGTSSGSTAPAVTSYSPPSNSLVIGLLVSGTATVTAGSGYTLDNTYAFTSQSVSSESKLTTGTAETTPLSLSASVAWNEVSLQVPPTEYQQTLEAAYPDGSPSGSGAPAWCYHNGVAASLGDLTTAGISVNCDYNTPIWVQSYVSNGGAATKTSDYSAFGGILNASALKGAWLLPGTPTSGTCTGTIPDFSHNNDTGTCENSPAFTTGPISGTGALNFTSSNTAHRYVSLAGTGLITSGSSFSVSFEFKKQTATAVGDVLSVATSLGGYAVGLGASPCSDTQMKATIYNVADICISGVPLDANSHYYTVSYTGSVVNLYVDGALAGSATQPGALKGGSFETAYVGVQGPTSGSGFDINGTLSFLTESTSPLSASTASELYSYESTVSNPQPLEVTPTTAGNTYTFDYYHQYAEAPYYSAVSGTPSGNALNYYYSDTGTSLTDTMGTSAATILADATTVTVGDHYVSSTERYSSNANVTLSSASLTGPKISIYHQYDQPTKISYPDGGSSTSVALTCTQYGANTPTTLATSSQNIWADSGGTCSVPATASIVSGASRLSMGPTYSWTVSASGSVPATLDGYLQYYLTNTVSLSVSGDSNGTSYQTSSSAYFDATTFTVTGHVITVSYDPQHQEWLYEVNQVYPMLLSAQPSVAPTMTQLQIGWTSECTSGCYFTLPSSTNNVFSSLTDNGVSITPNAIAIAGGTTYTFSGASPWLLTMTSNSLPPPSGGGGSSTPPPSCPTGELYDTSTGACITVTGTQTIYQAPPTGNFSQVVIGLGVVGALLVLVVGAILIDGSSKTGKKRNSSQPKVKRKELW